MLTEQIVIQLAQTLPKPGDLFTINGTDSNHEKAYLVTRVETPTDYYSGSDDAADAPNADNLRLHFVPP